MIFNFSVNFVVLMNEFEEKSQNKYQFNLKNHHFTLPYARFNIFFIIIRNGTARFMAFYVLISFSTSQ